VANDSTNVFDWVKLAAVFLPLPFSRFAMSDENQSPEEHEPAPVGTMVLMLLTAAGMMLAWLFLYFGIFLPRGTVS